MVASLFDEYGFEPEEFITARIEALMDQAGCEVMAVSFLSHNAEYTDLLTAVNRHGDRYIAAVVQGLAVKSIVRSFLHDTDQLDVGTTWASCDTESTKHRFCHVCTQFAMRFGRKAFTYSQVKPELLVFAEGFDAGSANMIHRLRLEGVPISAHTFGLNDDGLFTTPIIA